MVWKSCHKTISSTGIGVYRHNIGPIYIQVIHVVHVCVNRLEAWFAYSATVQFPSWYFVGIYYATGNVFSIPYRPYLICLIRGTEILVRWSTIDIRPKVVYFTDE